MKIVAFLCVAVLVLLVGSTAFEIGFARGEQHALYVAAQDARTGLDHLRDRLDRFRNAHDLQR